MIETVLTVLALIAIVFFVAMVFALGFCLGMKLGNRWFGDVFETEIAQMKNSGGSHG